jgi:hypothetical protein
MRKNLFGLWLLLVALALIVGGAVIVYAQAGILDGKNFIGEFGKKGKSADAKKDEIIFKDGKFRSMACDPYGFGDAPYRTKVDGETIAFEAETMSPKNGKIKWMGTVKGDQIEATFTWYASGQAPEESWLKGKLKK